MFICRNEPFSYCYYLQPVSGYTVTVAGYSAPEKAEQLQVDTLLELTIKTSGNRDYTEMQRSWDKADFIRTVFIENGLDPKRVSFIYGEPGNPSVIKIIIRKKADKFWGYHPAPPISGITGKYYIMKCN